VFLQRAVEAIIEADPILPEARLGIVDDAGERDGVTDEGAILA